jgi:hypothetical protein
VPLKQSCCHLSFLNYDLTLVMLEFSTLSIVLSSKCFPTWIFIGSQLLFQESITLERTGVLSLPTAGTTGWGSLIDTWFFHDALSHHRSHDLELKHQNCEENKLFHPTLSQVLVTVKERWLTWCHLYFMIYNTWTFRNISMGKNQFGL